jgi:hypothetical protein
MQRPKAAFGFVRSYFAQIFFLGAEFTQVLAKHGRCGLVPKKHAQNLPEPAGKYLGETSAQAERPPDAS